MTWWSKRRSRRLLSAAALVLLALIAGVVYFLGSPEFEEWAAGYAVRAIEDRTGTTASLTAFDVDFWRQRIDLIGLQLRGDEDPSERPLLAVERIEIGFSFRSLLQRRIDLWSLRVVRPEIDLRVGEGGRTNVPSPPARERDGGSIPLEIAIGDLVVSDGSLRIAENRADLDFRLWEVEGLFDFDEGTRILSGQIGFSGTIEGATDELIPYRLAADFDYTAGTVLLRPAVLTSGETRLTLQGRVDEFLGARTGALAYGGTVDLPFLNYFLPDTRFAGTSEVAGNLEFSTARFATDGHATSERLVVDDWVATDFETDFTYGFPERVVEASNLETGFAGGLARGLVTISPLPGSPRIEVDLTYQRIDPDFFGDFFPWGVDYVRNGRAAGSLRGWLEGGLDDFDLSGDIVLSGGARPEAGSQTPNVTGSTRFHWVPGAIEVSGLSAATGRTRAMATGLISAAALSLDATLESEDLGDLAFLYEGANGSGAFTGQISGSMAAPEFAGDFTLAGFRYEGWTFDRIEGAAALAGRRLQLTDVAVEENDSAIRATGFYDLDTGRPDLDVAITRLDVGELDSFIEPPVEGILSGRIHLTSYDPIELDGHIEAGGLTYDGRPLGRASADVVYGPGLIDLSDVRLERDGSSVTGTARYDPRRDALSVDAAVSGYDLEEFYWLGIPESIGGRVQRGRFTVEGSPGEPQVAGQVVIGNFAFGRQSFPEATIEVRTAGRLVHARMETDQSLEVEVDVDTSRDDYPFTGAAAFRGFDGGPLAGLPEGSVVATGDATFRGLLLDLGTLEGEGGIASLTASLEGQTLEVTRPFTVAFDTRRVRVSRVELIGGDRTSVELDGTIAIEPDAPLDLNVYGPIDLAVLGSRYENLDISGTLLLDAWVEGTLSDPELGGAATLTDVSLGHESVFVDLAGLSGDIFFDGPRASLIGLRGRMGGGEVTLSGEVGFGGAARGVMDIRADVSNVRIRTLAGLRTVFDGNLGLRGTTEAPVLEGNVQLLSLSFDESFNRFLELFDRGPGVSTDEGPLGNLALAVHVEGERNIRVENELASLESRVDLDIGGTYSSPSLTGHAEISSGTLILQGRRYRITRGNVDFVDPIGIDPRIDIQAEADVRDYRIILIITGRGDDIQLTMRSDPALPQLEIVSLIAGGRTSEELREEARAAGLDPGQAPGEELLFQGAASTILADMLQSRVGSRLGLLNSVRIDPFLVGAENDPVARLTISEQITSDLEITYSQDLSSNSQQIIQIEYFLNADTSFVASRDEAGRLGLDIRLRKRFD